ncbi:MAG: phosphoglucosamine mutase [Bacillota bacterium]
MGKYFGTDGIRGVAGEFLTTEFALKVGQTLKHSLNIDTIVIGKDTRQSSDMLAYSLASGAMSQGIDVLFAGTVSTPMIAHYSKVQSIVGIMITASHNPYQDNGIKIFINGQKPSQDQESTIENALDKDTPKSSKSIGTLTQTNEVERQYHTLYKNLGLHKINLSVGYDSANGANYLIAKTILDSICDESIQINNEPNGININVDSGSTHPKAIINLIKEKHLDIGFAFDGDGDRCLVVDHTGALIDGDLMIYAIAKYLKSQNRLTKDTVVLTKMSNPGIIKAFGELGIKTIRTDVGDKYVSEAMRKNGYALGGENSGHIIMKDFLHTGDGLLVAVMLLNILQDVKIPLRSFIEEVTMYPQKMVNIENIDKTVLEKRPIKNAIKKAEKTLGSDSLLLVRPSGTEPVIRVTISHQDETLLDRVMGDLVTSIQQEGGQPS